MVYGNEILVGRGYVVLIGFYGELFRRLVVGKLAGVEPRSPLNFYGFDSLSKS